MVERNLTGQLFDFLDHFPVIGIVGPRQVGKTTLIKENLHQFKKEAIYLDLESPVATYKTTSGTLRLPIVWRMPRP